MFVEGTHLARILRASIPEGVGGVEGVTHDSRAVKPGFAFVAVPGFKRDGVDFVPDALRRGAALVVAERGVAGAPVAVVPDAREALAALACAVFGNPSEKLEVHGVTGTNGKTTTSYALYQILSTACGEECCGLMTTAGTTVAGEFRGAVRTTPEATEVQQTLARMVERGVRRVVMEVSSHGIALKRVSGVRFSGAIFTNLSRDHLDLHGSMEEYYRTKRELFYRARGPKVAGISEGWGRRLAAEIEGTRTFGTAGDADYRVEGVRTARGVTSFLLRGPEISGRIETPLLGGYNVLNAAGAAALALELGVEFEDVRKALRVMPQVPGRFERIDSGMGFEVVVDYAHTEVGLEALLKVVREMAWGRVICVFGAAGERDRAKRPLMGRVASELADRSIITTDDAYSEDPAKIAREVASGADPDRTEVVLDRREAIRRALKEAVPEDVVVVAGKGHERVQHLPEGDIPFHDATVVGELLEELGERGR
jgi:UDP-N-acetylmuramoyl-L-alanyl-D-glutamate--2,6-diaminopimelate ligase